MMRWGLVFVLMVVPTTTLLAQAKGEKPMKPKKVTPAKVEPIPEGVRGEYKLAAYYKKYADADGVPVVSAPMVDDRALIVAAAHVSHILSTREDLRDQLVKSQIRVAIIPEKGSLLDLPENATLKEKPEVWERERSINGRPTRPVCAVAEEHLLGLPSDKTKAQSLLDHPG